ncbi:MAG: hypothetical protein M1827_004625 [Pycnora praestabilis]|nr:MAG: hypothetical protein M1827_004625 [Pycnora praestabilis]
MSGGVPEVGSGTASPPSSPPFAACAVDRELSKSQKSKATQREAAYTITEECERLFCEALKAVFLGERIAAEDCTRDSDWTLKSSMRLLDWVEVWDYAGDARFRGFVADLTGEKSLFVFFEEGAVGRDLKHGLMALLELASFVSFGCSRLVVCLDRETERLELRSMMRDLGWVGFELFALAMLDQSKEITSRRWIFLGMDT